MRGKVYSSKYRSFISLGDKNLWSANVFYFDPRTLFKNQHNKNSCFYSSITVYGAQGINNYVLTTTGKILLVMTFERFGGS